MSGGVAMGGGANLAGVMFATLAAEMADPERFRRGRTYVRQHAVASVEVQPAVAVGEVQGSRAAPYVVTIRVRPVRRAVASAAMAADGTVARAAALVPRPDDLRISCTCPDWGDPCKHAVAVLLVLGEQLAADPASLARWRQVTDPAPDEPGPARDGTRHDAGAPGAEPRYLRDTGVSEIPQHVGAAGDGYDATGLDSTDPLGLHAELGLRHPFGSPDPLADFFARDYDPAPIAPLPPRVPVRRAFDGSDLTAELVLAAVDSARAELTALFAER